MHKVTLEYNTVLTVQTVPWSISQSPTLEEITCYYYYEPPSSFWALRRLYKLGFDFEKSSIILILFTQHGGWSLGVFRYNLITFQASSFSLASCRMVYGLWVEVIIPNSNGHLSSLYFVQHIFFWCWIMYVVRKIATTFLTRHYFITYVNVCSGTYHLCLAQMFKSNYAVV